MLTWRSHNATRMESVRVILTGNRIRASGRIIAGDSDEHPAFSASYDLVTDESGVTKRLSLRSTVAAGAPPPAHPPPAEDNWGVDAGGAPQAAALGGGGGG
ncbi:putative glycolipid-binding domain-containing protein, partial [Nocardia wallacei]|uniref:putative glycolipid-binding domain-containing protein n=1 Tax=Nocardia wallacei TaxID=480035 RepID=UPI0024571243